MQLNKKLFFETLQFIKAFHMCHLCFEVRLEYHPTEHHPHRTEQTVGCRPWTYPLHNPPKGPTEVLDMFLPHSNKIRAPATADARNSRRPQQQNDLSIHGQSRFSQNLTLPRVPSQRPWLATQTHLRRKRVAPRHAAAARQRRQGRYRPRSCAQRQSTGCREPR